MFSKETRILIKGFLEGFIQGLVDEHKNVGSVQGPPEQVRVALQKSGSLKPFHEAILPPGIRRINSFERSFSTRLGSTFEACALLIAQETHPKAQRGFSMRGIEIPSGAAMKIEELVSDNNRYGMRKPFPDQVREVIATIGGKGAPRPAIADLYFMKADGSEWFFEMKSPKPNKGQCLEVTQRLLTIHAMQAARGKTGNTYFAMAYNPYGSRSYYNWPYALRHLDMKNQVLLQEEFWTIVGGDSLTYESLLAIYCEVGKEKGKDMIDQLAFGF